MQHRAAKRDNGATAVLMDSTVREGSAGGRTQHIKRQGLGVLVTATD